MTELSRACVCGHVFQEANRFINGKRFSGNMFGWFDGIWRNACQHAFVREWHDLFIYYLNPMSHTFAWALLIDLILWTEYRAKLYSRLEAKKMKRKAAENGPKQSNCSPSYLTSNPKVLSSWTFFFCWVCQCAVSIVWNAQLVTARSPKLVFSKWVSDGQYAEWEVLGATWAPWPDWPHARLVRTKVSVVSKILLETWWGTF